MTPDPDFNITPLFVVFDLSCNVLFRFFFFVLFVVLLLLPLMANKVVRRPFEIEYLRNHTIDYYTDSVVMEH